MNVIIFHGTGCSPIDFWYPWLKAELEADGYAVTIPSYPTINEEPIVSFIERVIQDNNFDENTILIGHSAGVPLILSILERIKAPVKKALLVAGFSTELEPGVVEPILQQSYDWAAIKNNAKDFVIFNSVNDPWSCDDKQGRKLFDELGGTFIIRQDGHFGSSKDPNFKQFPLLKLLVGAKL